MAKKKALRKRCPRCRELREEFRGKVCLHCFEERVVEELTAPYSYHERLQASFVMLNLTEL